MDRRKIKDALAKLEDVEDLFDKMGKSNFRAYLEDVARRHPQASWVTGPMQTAAQEYIFNLCSLLEDELEEMTDAS